MNNEPSTSGVTRRSFIKRSVVAAVAVSSLTIFSGLVDAKIVLYGTGASCQKKDIYQSAAPLKCEHDPGGSGYWVCTGATGSTVQCGTDDLSQEHKDITNPDEWVWCPSGKC